MENNFTPLTSAVRHNQMCIVRSLVEMGQDINEFDRWRYTPLQTAAQTRNEEIAKFLIESGADIHKASGTDLQPLHHACLQNSIECVQMLVDRGAHVNDIRNLMTPLVCAIIADGEEIIRLLISRGADVNYNIRGAATPLLVAMYRLHRGIGIIPRPNLRPVDRLRMRIVQTLIDAGADRRLLRVLGRNSNLD